MFRKLLLPAAAGLALVLAPVVANAGPPPIPLGAIGKILGDLGKIGGGLGKIGGGATQNLGVGGTSSNWGGGGGGWGHGVGHGWGHGGGYDQNYYVQPGYGYGCGYGYTQPTYYYQQPVYQQPVYQQPAYTGPFQIPAGYEGYGAGTMINYGGLNYVIAADRYMYQQ